MATKRALWAVIPLFFAIFSLAATVGALKKNEMSGATFGGCVTVLLFLLGMWMISRATQVYTERLGNIAVCHSGLRWHKGDQQSLALWTEIADVDVSSDLPQTGQTGLVGAMQALSAKGTITKVTIKTHAGETLVLRSETLADFVRFANTVHARHLQTLQEAQQTKQIAPFRGSFLPR